MLVFAKNNLVCTVLRHSVSSLCHGVTHDIGVFETFCKLISKMFNVNTYDQCDTVLKYDTEKKK